jgi:hypothetical protein
LPEQPSQEHCGQRAGVNPFGPPAEMNRPASELAKHVEEIQDPQAT